MENIKCLTCIIIITKKSRTQKNLTFFGNDPIKVVQTIRNDQSQVFINNNQNQNQKFALTNNLLNNYRNALIYDNGIL